MRHVSEFLPLSAETQNYMKHVEDVSGKPVFVRAEPSLSTLATVRTGRASAPAHLILYKPTAAAFGDYLVSYQCGFIERIFSLPEPDRFDVGGTYWGRKEAGKLVSEHSKKPGTKQFSRE